MAKKRDQIRMSDDEIWKFIEERKSLQFATIGRDGAPHLVTLWFAVLDGRIVIETFAKSQKVKNLERDPRVTMLVEDGETYDQLRGVQMRGRAEVVRDPARVHAVCKAVLGRNGPPMSDEQLEAVAQRVAAKRVALVVEPEHFVSWDHRKLGGAY